MNLTRLQPFKVSLLFVLLIIFNAVTLFLFGNSGPVIQYATVISCILFTVILIIALKEYYLVSLYLLPFVILHWWAILSVAYIETGIYITEQYEFGTRTGACLRLIIHVSAFLCATFLISYKRFDNYPAMAGPSKGIINFFNLIMAGSISVLALGIMYFGAIPLFSSNRFEYFALTPGIVKKVFLAHGILAFVAGLIYGKSRNKRTLSLFLVYLLFIVLSGDKFSAIFWAILSFYGGQKIAGYTPGTSVNIRKLLLFFGVIFALLLALVAVGFYYMHEINDSLAVAIMDRALGLQGHVWYGTDLLYIKGTLHTLPISDFFTETTFRTPKGVDYLMYEVSDTEFAAAMLDLGITFTMAFPAILLVYFGKYSLLVCLFLGCLLGFIVKENMKASIKGKILESIMLYGIYFILIDVFTMGRFWKLISIKMFAFLALLFILNVLRTRIKWQKSSLLLK